MLMFKQLKNKVPTFKKKSGLYLINGDHDRTDSDGDGDVERVSLHSGEGTPIDSRLSVFKPKLMQFVKDGNLQGLRSILDNQHPQDLIVVLRKHQVKTLKYEAQVETDLLPLACSRGHFHIVEYLLGLKDNEGESIVNVNEKGVGGATPLYLAVEGCQNHTRSDDPKYLEVIDFLLKHGADANIARDNGATPLYFAMQTNKVGIVWRLMRAPAIDPTKGKNNATPLWIACHEGHYEAIEAYLTALENHAKFDFQKLIHLPYTPPVNHDQTAEYTDKQASLITTFFSAIRDIPNKVDTKKLARDNLMVPSAAIESSEEKSKSKTESSSETPASVIDTIQSVGSQKYNLPKEVKERTEVKPKKKKENTIKSDDPILSIQRETRKIHIIGKDALQIAAEKGYLAIVRLLVEGYGADVSKLKESAKPSASEKSEMEETILSGTETEKSREQQESTILTEKTALLSTTPALKANTQKQTSRYSQEILDYLKSVKVKKQPKTGKDHGKLKEELQKIHKPSIQGETLATIQEALETIGFEPKIKQKLAERFYNHCYKYNIKFNDLTYDDCLQMQCFEGETYKIGLYLGWEIPRPSCTIV